MSFVTLFPTLLSLSSLQSKTRSRTLLDTLLPLQKLVPYQFSPYLLACITGTRDCTPQPRMVFVRGKPIWSTPSEIAWLLAHLKGGSQLGPRGGCQVGFETASSEPGCGIEFEDFVCITPDFCSSLSEYPEEAPLVQLRFTSGCGEISLQVVDPTHTEINPPVQRLIV